MRTQKLADFQRRVKAWRALEGPAKEVFFAQDYVPGERCQSDFTWMKDLAMGPPSLCCTETQPGPFIIAI